MLNVFPRDMFPVWLPGFKSRFGGFTWLFNLNESTYLEGPCLSNTLTYHQADALSIPVYKLSGFPLFRTDKIP